MKILAAMLLAASFAGALPSKPASGRVADFANALDLEGRRKLQAASDQLASHTGAKLYFVTVPSLENSDVADYANRLFKAWKLGDKDKNNGVLILVCPGERKSRIEVGYGLEAKLPDIVVGRILKDEMRPYFIKGRYAEGLLLGARRVSAVLAGEAPRAPMRPPEPNPFFSWLVFFFAAPFYLLGGYMLASALASQATRKETREGRVGVSILGALFSAAGFFLCFVEGPGVRAVAPLWAAAVLWGAWVGRRKPNLYKAAPSRGGGGSSSGSSGSWSDSGGSSGGGGGDSGGGDSGGGGASDSW